MENTSIPSGWRDRHRAGRIWAYLVTAWAESRQGVAVDRDASLAVERPEDEQSRAERIQTAIAAVFFFGTFVTVCVEVAARYLGHPVVWAIELPTYCFIWAWGFAAGLADWSNDQLAFSLVADLLPRRLRLVLQRTADVLIVSACVAVLPGTVTFLSVQATQPNVGLPLSEMYGEAGVFVLFASVAVLRARIIVLSIAEEWRARRPVQEAREGTDGEAAVSHDRRRPT